MSIPSPTTQDPLFSEPEMDLKSAISLLVAFAEKANSDPLATAARVLLKEYKAICIRDMEISTALGVVGDKLEQVLEVVV